MSTLSRSSFSAIPTSYATVSVGTPKHPLLDKLKAISAAGFQGIELGFPDLLNFAYTYHGTEIDSQDFTALNNAAKEVRTMCDNLELKIVMLQPFANFEGWPAESEERKDAFTRAKGWIQVMTALSCDMLQVSPSVSLSFQSADISLLNLFKGWLDGRPKHKYFRRRACIRSPRAL